MSLAAWLTDRIILGPSRHEIHAPRREALTFDHEGGALEIWVHRAGQTDAADPDLYLLEFPGTASRAEDQTQFVEDCWQDLCVEIWSVNPPGYGGSSGAASLRKLPLTAERALQEICRVAGNAPLLVAGGSLGSVSALYLAARHPVAGVLVQNPPALRQVVMARTRWWHFPWAARWVADQIPDELDSLANAARSRAPAVFISAERDSVVPATLQRQVIYAYDGPLKVLSLPDADHATPMTAVQLSQLQPLARWLYDAAEKG